MPGKVGAYMDVGADGALPGDAMRRDSRQWHRLLLHLVGHLKRHIPATNSDTRNRINFLDIRNPGSIS